MRSLEDVNLVDRSVNLHRHDEIRVVYGLKSKPMSFLSSRSFIRLMPNLFFKHLTKSEFDDYYYLEGTVNERLIEINDYAFFVRVLRPQFGKEMFRFGAVTSSTSART